MHTGFLRAMAWALFAIAGLACSPQKPPAAPAPKKGEVSKTAPPPVVSLAASVGNASPPVKNAVASRITKVTVYSDRALVTREAEIPVTTKAVVHRFAHLPGWVDEGSVRARTRFGKIVDVAVERRFLARATDAGFQKLEQEHNVLLERVQALDDELAILAAQATRVHAIEVFSAEKLSTDVVTRDIHVDTYGQVVDFVSDRLRKTAAAKRKAIAERARLEPIVVASAANLEELRRLTTLEETTVLVTLQGKTAGSADVAITYATPGATWEPMHDLRIDSAKASAVNLTSYAVVSQTTGEDWSRANLSFSTQSSSDPENIPELEMLALGQTRDVTRTQTRRTTTFNRAQQAYEQQHRHWNRMNQAQSKTRSEVERFEKSYSTNLEYFERVQSKTVEIFHGLEQRGTNAHFAATNPTMVRSDGRPIRLRIGAGSVQADMKIIAAPEESLNAALALQMVNSGKQPLLPGQVARYRDGAFLGMTDLPFVAAGEDFSVFFSVADQVKLTRKLDRKQSSLVRRSRNRMRLSFVTTAKNLACHPVTAVLAERVPVSQTTDVQVSRVKLAPNATPDRQGIVRWTMTLAPGEERELRVSYQVDYPSTLALDVKRRRAAPRPASPMVTPQHDFEERIHKLEREL